MAKKCDMHYYMLEEQAPNKKGNSLGVCKKCGHKKVHSNINKPVSAKRVVAKGREPQEVIGITLKGNKPMTGKARSPHFNPSRTEHNVNKSRPHFANGFKGG